MSTLQTLDRGLRALDVVSRSANGISVADLARELDVHRAICYRIAATLEAHGLVSRTEDGLLRLGVGTAVLGARFEPGFTREARVLLRSLANETGATAFVSAAEGPDCVVIMVAEPESAALRVAYRVGSRHPLTKGAAGIAILAARPESRSDTDELRQVRRDGYSITSGQLERGAVGVAAGVRAVPGSGFEHSIGVVALEGFDTAVAAKAVRSAARSLEDHLPQ
ncbi:helix-turn-helix domain-containing protein [Umezawaea sp. Da 62-37]|uniref:IclR family transcriptional regulator n=1 Tax=Umezawaea sp. Da 62-37 TaxID=3075927 RepID=UPI0028F70853|nr:helix-turn-helix domain-containing protein [Umezawaea sp. Da 62-37]WNV82939.1 helix-turn-helix domain-containing protein [Umezawaea sp. Da 62-37]